MEQQQQSIDEILAQHQANVMESLRRRLERQAVEEMEQDHAARQAAAPADPEEARRLEMLYMGMQAIDAAAERMAAETKKRAQHLYDLSDERLYQAHAKFLVSVADNLVLAPQRRRFVIDDDNKQVLRFLLYYFNSCPLCEQVFPDRGYRMHKHILLQGKSGTGKTLLMQIFSEYLRLTRNPNYFQNLSVTQMVNYYTLHNNLDRYTYNEESGKGFQSQPVNICLNDIGVQTTTFFGMDTNVLTNEFLHARNEIWANYHCFAHLTTNLTNEQLRDKYRDGFGRLVDRFKTYNIIPLTGESRR